MNLNENLIDDLNGVIDNKNISFNENKNYALNNNSLNTLQYNTLNYLYDNMLLFETNRIIADFSIDNFLEAYRLNPILAVCNLNQMEELKKAILNTKTTNKTSSYNIIKQHIILSDVLGQTQHTNSYVEEARLRFIMFKNANEVFDNKKMNRIYSRFLDIASFNTISGIIYLFKTQDESFLKLLNPFFIKPTNFKELEEAVISYFFVIFCMENANDKNNIEECKTYIWKNLNHPILKEYLKRAKNWDYEDVLKLAKLCARNQKEEKEEKQTNASNQTKR